MAPQKPNFAIAADPSPRMNDDSMLAARVLASPDSFSPSLSPSLSPVHELSVINSERGPLPHTTAQAIETRAPAGESAPQPEPVTSHIIHGHSADARTGDPQVHRAADAGEQLFVLKNPFRARPAGTTASTPEAAKRERWTKLGYLSLALFCLPTFYFMRVARMFEDAQLTPREVEQGMKGYMEVTELSRGLRTFKELWEGLVDSMLRGWKTLNLVAALLLTAILMLLQMPSVDTNPTWRNTSFLSLAVPLVRVRVRDPVWVIKEHAQGAKMGAFQIEMAEHMGVPRPTRSIFRNFDVLVHRDYPRAHVGNRSSQQHRPESTAQQRSELCLAWRNRGPPCTWAVILYPDDDRGLVARHLERRVGHEYYGERRERRWGQIMEGNVLRHIC
ncbi:hypothetical protein APHAL10511_003227 [Amanita phalloides]|nr:hypothetical protein APHAL10511_003227 [Amanita phalloides]